MENYKLKSLIGWRFSENSRETWNQLWQNSQERWQITFTYHMYEYWNKHFEPTCFPDARKPEQTLRTYLLGTTQCLILKSVLETSNDFLFLCTELLRPCLGISSISRDLKSFFRGHPSFDYYFVQNSPSLPSTDKSCTFVSLEHVRTPAVQGCVCAEHDAGRDSHSADEHPLLHQEMMKNDPPERGVDPNGCV